MMLFIVIIALVLSGAVALAVLAGRYSALQSRVRSLELRGEAAERELAAARRQAAQAEADQVFLARFVRELPHVAHELHAGASIRQIPKLLLGATIRVLEPKKVLVAVRRRSAESDPGRQRHLAVAAVFPDGYMDIGAEISIGDGEIGYAAEVQRVLDRRDFEHEPPPTRRRLREETPDGCQPDVVAPMIFNEEVLGVIAVEGLRRGTTEAKDVLRLLAQVGAVSVHTLAKYTEMKATASIDGLTGIFNKRYLAHRLGEEIRRAMDQVSSVSVFIFDVDHFKHYNDRNGHVSGDRLLQKLARLVQENVRQDSIFGRYGGEEFLLILPGTSRAGALAAAENVRGTIAAHEFPFGFDQPLGLVSISGGVAECPEDGRDAATLVRAADDALYQAKRGGRNRVVAHEPTYLGGVVATEPRLAEGNQEARERVVLQSAPKVGASGEAVTLAVTDLSAPHGSRMAEDFTPVPGTLLALASVTPAAGIPKLTLEPTAEVLSAAADAAAPPVPSADAQAPAGARPAERLAPDAPRPAEPKLETADPAPDEER